MYIGILTKYSTLLYDASLPIPSYWSMEVVSHAILLPFSFKGVHIEARSYEVAILISSLHRHVSSLCVFVLCKVYICFALIILYFL